MGDVKERPSPTQPFLSNDMVFTASKDSSSLYRKVCEELKSLEAVTMSLVVFCHEPPDVRPSMLFSKRWPTSGS